jgi:hypothetical protein
MTKFTPAAKHLGPTPFGSDDSRLVLRPVVAGWVAVLGDALTRRSATLTGRACFASRRWRVAAAIARGRA